MDQKQRRILRAAQLLRDSLLQLRRGDARPELPNQQWTNLLQLSRRVELAQNRGWNNAARRLTDDLRREIRLLQAHLLSMSNTLDSRMSREVPGEGDIFREIMALEEEFDQVDADPKTREICVTTEPICLEGIYLGPFEIHLDLQSIGELSPYRVVAVEPNPASSRDSVTHPHVEDETLCEGEGRAAIRAALSAGRLYDFFVLVHRILNTYARGDAYVELSDWEGVSCGDCGSLTNEDDRVPCRSCDNPICFECAVTCQVCGHDHCSSCVSSCGECDNHVCDSCLELCSVCGKQTCSDCLTDGTCTQCHEKEEANDENQTTAETAGAELAVQSAGLGQVAVPP
jgi:hypothetical protein